MCFTLFASTMLLHNLPKSVNCCIKLFADDTDILDIVSTIEEIRVLESNVQAAMVWSEQWQLAFNQEKYFLDHLGYNNNRHSYTRCYMVIALL